MSVPAAIGRVFRANVSATSVPVKSFDQKITKLPATFL
jgi:hypothetical protein